MLASLILFFFTGAILCFYGPNSKVQELNGGTFNDVVHKNERTFMVEFYAPYCGHCKKMIPAYTALAANLDGIVDVAAIDCTQSFNQAICSRYDVQGYPTIKLFVFNGKGNHKRAIDYSGSRTTADMTEFIKKHASSFIFKISSQPEKRKTPSKWNVDLTTFFSKGESLPKLILFRPDSNTPSTVLFRALSVKYHYKIVMGEISLAEGSDLVKQSGLDGIQANSLVFFPSGTSSPSVKYTGSFKRTELFAFLDEQLSKAQENKAKDEL